jgi:hypothetical protein
VDWRCVVTLRIVTEGRRMALAAVAAAVLTSSCGPDKTPTSSPTTRSTAAAAPARGGDHRSRVVYIADNTGDAWPVDAAVRQWSAGLTTLSVRYAPCPDHPPANTRCVKVREGGAFDDTQLGRTTRLSHNIRMNPAYAGLPYEQRLAAVCHELGHALGLTRHNEDPDSCMNAEIGDDTSTRPGKRDLADLNTSDGGAS